MEQPILLKRLSTIRGTVRRRLVTYGVCMVASGGVASFLAIVVFDWLLRLPAFLRLTASAVFFLGFLAATWHWILSPLRSRFALDEIAARLERHFGGLHDSLSSTVSFVSTGAEREAESGSPSLIRHVIADTDNLVSHIRLDDALTLRPLLRSVVLFAVSAALLAATLAAAPNWVQTGFYRFCYPFGEFEWPRRVSIVPLTGAETAAVGESVTLGMAIARGMHESLRGVVHLKDMEGNRVALAMQESEPARFHVTIDSVTSDLDYWFEAGDADTKERPSRIRVVRRPEIVEAFAAVEAPPYARGRPAQTHDLLAGPVNAVIGGWVTIDVRASKPVPQDSAAASSGLRLDPSGTDADEEAFMPLAVARDDPTRLSTRFEVTGDVHFRIELHDEEGFENRRPATYSILARADAPPTITIIEPNAYAEVTPRGKVRITARVEDDFGLTDLLLNADLPPDGRPYSVPLRDKLAAVPDGERISAMLDFEWSMKTLSVSPGDVLTFQLQARDVYAGENGGQAGVSAPSRIRIVSDLDFDVRMRDELSALGDRMREMALDEAELRNGTSALERHLGENGPLDGAQLASLRELASRQSRLTRRGKYLSQRFKQLGELMERNRPDRTESRVEAGRIGESLGQLASGPMTRAGGGLVDAGAREPSAEQRGELQEAAREQQAAIDGLHALIRATSQWGSFQWFVSRTRDLRDKQDDIRTSTGLVGRDLLGRPADSLEEAEAAELKRVHRMQLQLAADLEDLLARMGLFGESDAETDPSSAGAIEDALRTARAENLARRIHSAADAIGLNRTAAADIDQRAALDSLRRMLSALQGRDDRALALLRKQLQRSADQVALLITEQTALRAATHEAALIDGAQDLKTLDDLEHEQHRIRRNTDSVAKELSENVQAAQAARAVRLADAPMGESESQLRHDVPGAAEVAQDQAIELLTEAREMLEELAQETAESEFRRSLAQIREALERIRDEQAEVNGGLATLRQALVDRGGFGRNEARDAARLARRQSEVYGLLNETRPLLAKVPVFEWALGRVADWMQNCINGLTARSVDERLVASAERIVDELQRLIAAIMQTESMRPDVEFAEAEGTGGGGRTLAGKPVPTVAELLVLKALQTDINQRTTELFESIDPDNATEDQLRALTVTGEDQAQVGRLTEHVTKSARNP